MFGIWEANSVRRKSLLLMQGEEVKTERQKLCCAGGRIRPLPFETSEGISCRAHPAAAEKCCFTAPWDTAPA